MKVTDRMLSIAFNAADATDDVSTEKMRAALLAVFQAGAAPEGYAIVQTAPLMEMLEEGWDAMDSEGDADFFDPEALAPAWADMVAWCVRNPGAQP